MSLTTNNFTRQHLTLVTKNILAKVKKKCLISGTEATALFVSVKLTSLVEHSDAQPSEYRFLLKSLMKSNNVLVGLGLTCA